MHTHATPLPIARLLWCAAAIVTLSMGVRHGFGLWLGPVTLERVWTRETFSLALAVQNLVWGLAGPFTGLAADRLGAHKVLALGALLYGAGLAVMALAAGPALFIWGSGLLLGVARAPPTRSCTG